MTSSGQSTPALITVALSGMGFGFSQLMGKIAEPLLIQQQMKFESFEMSKMFFAALSTSALSIAALGVLFKTLGGKWIKAWYEAYDDYSSCVKTRGWAGSALGGILLGAGMRLCGACPGTVWVQLGAQIPLSSFTVTGCLVGTFLFKACEECFRGVGRIGKLPHVYLHQILWPGEGVSDSSSKVGANGSNSQKIGSSSEKQEMEMVCEGDVCMMRPRKVSANGSNSQKIDNSSEKQEMEMVCEGDVCMMRPRKAVTNKKTDEVTHSASNKLPTGYLPLAMTLGGVLAASAAAFQLFDQVTTFSSIGKQWPPYLTGVLVGSLQIPTMFAVQDTLGSTSGYRALASLLLGQKPSGGGWQMVFGAGAAVGGFLAQAVLSKAGVGLVGAKSAIGAFLGGIGIVVGPSIAGGCTSGHGLSGLSFLTLTSMFTVAGMFGGGALASGIINLAGLNW